MRPDDIVPDGAVGIPLRARDGTVRAIALVDAADAAFANQWTWRLEDGYARRRVVSAGRERRFHLHRELLSLVYGDGYEGDHRSRDRLDNRRANLRSVPKHGKPNNQNVSNQARSASQYRGVAWHRQSQKWQARVSVNGKSVYLGLFADEHEAAAVARAARRRLLPYAVD